MAAVDNQRKLFQMASRCVFKNYNDIKNIRDINGEFGNHVLDYNNPHNVNKAQVGLSNVPNTDCTNPANITQSSDYRFVTDTEKSTWNSKSDFSGSYDDLTDIPSGYTGSITVVTGVDFILMTTTTSTITISNGIITSIV